MAERDTNILMFSVQICLYAVKAFCILFFLIQVVRYHRFTKHELRQQDKFTLKSFKIMSIVFIAAFINYTYQIVLLVGKSLNDGFEKWVNEQNGLAWFIQFSLLSINAVLMGVCYVFNLARWYLIL